MSQQSPLPKRLKEARSKLKISQKELGIKAGIEEFSASSRMNQYEKGTHAPDFSTLKNIAEVLGVPTAYFYAEDDALAQYILRFDA
ncbi:MAG: XRE family transcriptional regulator [Oleiphilus sp.]|nr:MAG: XRE family transcriptional regulator [Oleiphilus sp.]